MGLYSCRIVHQTEVTDGIFILTFAGKEIVQECRPGQFVHVRLGEGFVPFWRRPFSIHRIDSKAGTFQILYRVLGGGTEILSRKKPGDFLNVMGPLGNGFRLDGSWSHGLVVVGGVGSAALFFLSDVLHYGNKTITFLWGVRKQSELFGISGLEFHEADVRIATEDGSLGYRGRVTDLLKKTLGEGSFAKKDVKGFVCGPKDMIRQVQTIAEKTDFEWQVLLEEKMACGINVCKGCAVKMRQGGFSMVCSDGPMFDLREVILED